MGTLIHGDSEHEMAKRLSHVNKDGKARMVDVGAKPVVVREAVAEGYLRAVRATLDLVEKGGLPKGDALATARLAGIMAAKRCDELIPLCHTLPLDHVDVRIDRAGADLMRIEATVRMSGRTGVEMEALTAVCIAALTLYDMTKAVDKAMSVEGVRLVRKTKSG